MRNAASYKDRSGYIFSNNNTIYRHLHLNYKSNYESLISSQLYSSLISKKYLIEHIEIQENLTQDEDWFLTLKPKQIDFITYPFEWSFEQLKTAALLTLEIMQECIKYNITLKDATPFNIQYEGPSPILIDSASFEKADFSKPWIAYRQFCETFLFPLIIESYNILPANHILTIYPNGISAAQTKKLLPFKSAFNLSNIMNVYLNSFISNSNTQKKNKLVNFNKKKFEDIISYLKLTIQKLKRTTNITTWNTYYNDTIISKEYLNNKAILIEEWTTNKSYSNILDIGCNEGFFSILLKEKATSIVSIDEDLDLINKIFVETKKQSISNILPLHINFVSPLFSSGFFNSERIPFFERKKFDLCLMLAVIHHLIFTHKINFEILAKNLSIFCNNLIIEFVPKSDEKVKLLLLNQEDIFTDYTEANFIKIFENHFTIIKSQTIISTERKMFYLENKKNLVLHNSN